MNLNLLAPYAALRICVSHTNEGDIEGMVYSNRLTAPLPYHNLIHLLFQLEQLLDTQNFPQAYQRLRTFLPNKEFKLPAAASPEAGLPLEEVHSATGEMGGFTLTIFSRRETTWQGSVDWEDGSEPEHFSSEMQLIHSIWARYSG
jgi:hypothetical protein